MNYIARKRKWLPLFAVVASLLLGSCTKKFEQYNTNPNALYTKDLIPDFHFLGDPLKQAQLNIYVATPAWNTQLQQNLMGDVYSGYMSSPTPFANNINNLTYSLVDGWNTYPWDDGYNSVMSPLNYLFKNASATAYPGFFAVAKIVRVEAMHRVSDIYGPIIYKKYGIINADGTVSYDSQKDDYYAFFDDLDSAIRILTPFAQAHLTSDTLKTFDLAYGGSYTAWLKMANTLKLRLALRIVNVDPTKAQAEGEAALANPVGLMTANTDNFNINIGTTTHPLNVMNNSPGRLPVGRSAGFLSHGV
ncbi:SusD/RagB family nutrient-binding outer membrane lipoprotein [Puia sp. P3]|uniref:SusD/RagB family nutrient-binding outer membrane lipoprotein n=1 Tax=Puia sp. P3 TaxID=3423952 RepID=UPI003D6663B5